MVYWYLSGTDPIHIRSVPLLIKGTNIPSIYRVWHSWKQQHKRISKYICIKKLHEQMSEYICITFLTQTNVQLNICIENCTNILIFVLFLHSNNQLPLLTLRLASGRPPNRICSHKSFIRNRDLLNSISVSTSKLAPQTFRVSGSSSFSCDLQSKNWTRYLVTCPIFQCGLRLPSATLGRLLHTVRV